METVNNIAAAASKAIWGEPEAGKTSTGHLLETNDVTTGTNETAGKEPLSGVLGDVKAGEPYDKGNVEPTTTTDTTSKSLPIRTTETAPLAEGIYEPSSTPDPTYKPEVAAAHASTDKVIVDTPSIASSDPTPTSVADLTPKSASDTAIPGTSSGQTAGHLLKEIMGKEEAKQNGTEAAEQSGAPASSKAKKSEDDDASPKEKEIDFAAAEGKPPAPISKTEDKIPSSSTKTNTAKSGPPISSEPNTLKTGPPTIGVETMSGNSLKTESPALTAKPVDVIPSATASTATPAPTAESDDADEKDGKEKLSFKDKIKAKLHKH